jgi:hypothetical protein
MVTPNPGRWTAIFECHRQNALRTVFELNSGAHKPRTSGPRGLNKVLLIK